MKNGQLETYRAFLKDSIRKEIDFSATDQNRGLPPPPIEKPFSAEGKRIDLPKPETWKTLGSCDVTRAVRERRSVRAYLPDFLSLEEISFLLWSTQGIRQRLREGHAFRTVPSAGCRHPFETYLCVLHVEGLDPGVYRFLPLEHQLLFEFSEERLPDRLVAATLDQSFVGRAAVTFVWTTLPYRTEWRYGIAAHKVIALDAGHVCQNLYIACEAISSGTCAIAAYDQEEMDRLLRIDGREEFTIYLAPVGKVKAYDPRRS